MPAIDVTSREDVREYVHRIRNEVNAPIMRAAILSEMARDIRSRALETRLRAQEARARIGAPWWR